MRSIANKQQYLLIGIVLLWCGALLAYWRLQTADPLAVGMLWNLFLAVLPLGFSAAFRGALARRSWVLSGLAFGGWLLFFPNAPYVMTDLIHLHPRSNIPLWYLLATLLSCGGTGVWLGYLSLGEVHVAVATRWGSKVGWVVVVGSLLLSGFGIYLGRFLRWNSWDVFVHPLSLAKTIVQQLLNRGPYPHPIPVTLIFGVGLFLGYLALGGGSSSKKP